MLVTAWLRYEIAQNRIMNDSKSGFPRWWQQTIIPSISLFTSLGTLVCCALPALLVSLGMGATLVGLISVAPWLVALSEYKGVVFSIAGGLLLMSLLIQYQTRNAPCPIDPIKARACQRMRRLSWFILFSAITIYMVGLFFAFIAVMVF